MTPQELLQKLTNFYLAQQMEKFSDTDLDAGYALMSPADKQAIIKSVLTGTDAGHVIIKNAIIASVTTKATQLATDTITAGHISIDQIANLL